MKKRQSHLGHSVWQFSSSPWRADLQL